MSEWTSFITREEALRPIEGWTLVQVSGDIPVEGRTSRLRMCFKSPDGEYRNVYVEPNENHEGDLQYYTGPAEHHHKETLVK